MQILPGSTPGSNAGGTAPGAPEVSPDLAGLVRPGPASLELPDEPDGWTPSAWNALRRSSAVRDANTVFDLAKKLLDYIGDFGCDHGPNVDLDVVMQAGAPIPSRNLWRLKYVRQNFAGIEWALGQMIDCVGDILPEPLDTEPKPEAASTPKLAPTPPHPETAAFRDTLLATAAHVEAFRKRFKVEPGRHGWREHAADDLAGVPWHCRHAAGLLILPPAANPAVKLARDADEALSDVLVRMERCRAATERFLVKARHTTEPFADALTVVVWAISQGASCLWGNILDSELRAARVRADAAEGTSAKRRAA